MIVAKVSIRKQGGAAIMTIPPNVLKSLQVDIGSVLALDIQDGGFIAKPDNAFKRKRYKLSELMMNVTPEAIEQLNADTEWARDGGSVGLELP